VHWRHQAYCPWRVTARQAWGLAHDGFSLSTASTEISQRAFLPLPKGSEANGPEVFAQRVLGIRRAAPIANLLCRATLRSPLWVISGHSTRWLGISAFRPEPDLATRSGERPLSANNRHQRPNPPAPGASISAPGRQHGERRSNPPPKSRGWSPAPKVVSARSGGVWRPLPPRR
jgi:hypothetical protein